MAEVERAMIVAAYERSNRRPLVAARLLGIGKTTVYRKLRAMGSSPDGCRYNRFIHTHHARISTVGILK